MSMGRLPIFCVWVLAVGLCTAQSTASTGETETAPQSPAPQTEAFAKVDVALGEPIEWELPKYPSKARKKGLQGNVVLQLGVNEEGDVNSVDVIAGDAELAESAINEVRKWKYVPYEVNGKPTAVTTRVTIHFNTGSGHPDVTATCEVPPTPELGRIFKVSDGVTPPKAISSPVPQYSKEAKNLKYQGVCILELIVGPDGRPYHVRIVRPLKEDLDRQAVKAVLGWKFQPATKNGTPVAVLINVEVAFRLY